MYVQLDEEKLCIGRIGCLNLEVVRIMTIETTYCCFGVLKYEACPKSIRLYFFPEKPVTAGWQI
jgi:hypothetical protein